MYELDQMDEETIVALLDHLAMGGRHVTFAGSKMKSLGGMGTIRMPLLRGPVVQGRVIATLGAPYAIPGDDHGAPCCPHFCDGAITEGAQDVLFEGQPVVMVGHMGQHRPICGGTLGRAVVVEGWKIAYRASRDYGLKAAEPVRDPAMGSANMDHTVRWVKQMSAAFKGR